MSIEAIAWAWKKKLPANQKLVLLALADHSDHRGICWPGQHGLVEKTGISRSAMKRARNELETIGLIRIERRPNNKKTFLSNIYHLMLSTPPGSGADLPPGSGADLPPGSGADLPPGSGADLPPGPERTYPRVRSGPTPGSGADLPWVRSGPTLGPERTPNRHLTVKKNTTTPLILASVADCGNTPTPLILASAKAVKTTPLPPHGGTARVARVYAGEAADAVEGPKTCLRDAEQPPTPEPSPAMNAFAASVPDVIPEDIRPTLLRQLASLGETQAGDVLATIATRLRMVESGKAEAIENMTGYAQSLAKKAAKGELDIPPNVAMERNKSRLASDLERLRRACEAGHQLVVDGTPVTPDPWPYLRMGKGCATVGSLLATGAVIEAKCASP